MRFDNWSVGEAIVNLIEELKIMTKSWVKTLVVLAISFPLSAQTQQHFARVFRALCKMSPTQFRQARLA
jgi:hypothetical protein